MKIKSKFLSLTGGVATLSLMSFAFADDMDKKIEDILKIGKDGAVKFDVNYRWEHVNQDEGIISATNRTAPKTANANTIRSRIGVLSPSYQNFQAFAEYEGNFSLENHYHNNRPDEVSPYSRIADPEVHELNQLWLSFKGISDTEVKGGRQRIKFDDDRFIGNVGWRQAEMTYDSVLVNNKSLPNTVINAGYIGNIQTILSTTETIDAPILNINYKLGDYGNFIGYAYWLDYDEVDTAAKSSQTYGLRLNGATPKIAENYKLLYTAEWGVQNDYGHRAAAYEAHRYNVMGGLSAHFLTFQGAMEQLDGTSRGQFNTPLGTNHAFQGWADLFLVTPVNGIRDVFGTVSAKFMDDSLVVSGIYHDFTDDTGRIHYGDEWDFQAVKKFGKHYSLLAKCAFYNADTRDGYAGTGVFSNTDTQKFWLQGNISF
jgi:hypothetical protein